MLFSGWVCCDSELPDVTGISGLSTPEQQWNNWNRQTLKNLSLSDTLKLGITVSLKSENWTLLDWLGEFILEQIASQQIQTESDCLVDWSSCRPDEEIQQKTHAHYMVKPCLRNKGPFSRGVSTYSTNSALSIWQQASPPYLIVRYHTPFFLTWHPLIARLPTLSSLIRGGFCHTASPPFFCLIEIQLGTQTMPASWHQILDGAA